MITTPHLIDALVAQAGPVRRLRPPLQRAGLWLLFAGGILALFAALHGVRPNLLQRLHDPVFAVSLLGAAATGILAAVAAFHVSLPDRAAAWGWLPAPAAALWFATIGYGCLTDWVGLEPDGVRLGTTLQCFATLVLTSAPLSLALFLMLRHAAPTRPTEAAVMGSLAVAGLTATALALFHSIDATVMVLIWNLGTAVVMLLIGAAYGRRLLAWTARPMVHGA